MGACILCEEQITNPLCPERIEEQMSTWLNERQPELITKFFEVSSEIISKNSSFDRCIIKDKSMNICPYCYSQHILHWLLSISPSWDLLKEFFLHFDYYREHLGHSLNENSPARMSS